MIKATVKTERVIVQMNLESRLDRLEKVSLQAEKEDKCALVIIKEGEAECEAIKRQGAENAKIRLIVEE